MKMAGDMQEQLRTPTLGKSEILYTAVCLLFKQPALCIIAQRGKDECRYEFGVVDHVRSLREVNGHGQCAEWGTGLVETPVYSM